MVWRVSDDLIGKFRMLTQTTALPPVLDLHRVLKPDPD